MVNVGVVGRDQEAARLVELLTRASSGRRCLALVEGEAGIGKTTLLQSVLDRAREAGFHVLAGRAHELERMRPFAPIADALAAEETMLDDASAALVDLIGGKEVPAGNGGPESQFHAIDTLVDHVEALAQHAPVAFAIEDVHWSDPGTVLALHALARRGPDRLVVFATLRPSPHSEELRRLIDTAPELGAHHLRLDPLNSSEVNQLAEQILKRRPGDRLSEYLHRTGGNPLFVTELLRTLLDKQGLEFGADQAEIAPEAANAVSSTLRLTIVRHLSTLPEPTLRLLRIASVLGSSFVAGELAAFSGEMAVTLFDGLEPALRDGVLAEEADRLRFRHPLVRDALYDEIPLPVRKEMHRDAARHLAAAKVSAPRVAAHFSLAADPGDEEAVDCIYRAGLDVMETGPSVAVELFDRALTLCDARSPRRNEILSTMLTPLKWLGRSAEGEHIARQLLDVSVEPSTRGALLQELASLLIMDGRADDAEVELKRALTVEGVSDEDRASILGALAFNFDHAHLVDEALALARETGDLSALSLAMLARSRWLVRAFDVHAAAEAGAEAVELAKRLVASSDRVENPLWLLGTALLWYAGLVLPALDRDEEALHISREVLLIAERHGAVAALPLSRNSIAEELFLLGAWDDALAEIDAASHAARELGGILRPPPGMLPLISILRGEMSGATSALETELALGPPVPNRGPSEDAPLGYIPLCQALLSEGRGDVETSRAAFSSIRAFPNPTLLPFPEVVRVLIALGAEEVIDDEVMARLAEQAVRAHTSLTAGAETQVRGLVKEDPDLLLEAARIFDGTHRPLMRANASLDAATALARAGRVAEAEPRFEAALAFYEEVGARQPIARCLAVMRQAGIRRGARGRRPRATVGWDSLTRSERDIVRLTAEGLRNREIGDRLFISPRTVQSHLTSIFRKLGMASRAELAASAARRTLG